MFDRTEAYPRRSIHRLRPGPDPAAVPAAGGEHLQRRCAGPQGITVLDAFECWHYQHGRATWARSNWPVVSWASAG
ncbi:MAG: hypothetical protein R2705_19935 [Ilumatobacteraceae bacterium]